MDTENSPAMEYLALAWKSEGHGQGKSWRRLNHVMQMSLQVAIEGGFRFDKDDFAAIAKRFNSAYWIGESGELYYRRACAGAHGPNASAIQAYEAWLGRKPFIVKPKPMEEAKVRLSVSETFEWYPGFVFTKENRHYLKVTSFVDHPPKPDSDFKPYVVACSYKTDPETNDRSKVDRVFKITHDDIKAYHAAIKAQLKAMAEAEAKAKEAAAPQQSEVA